MQAIDQCETPCRQPATAGPVVCFFSLIGLVLSGCGGDSGASEAQDSPQQPPNVDGTPPSVSISSPDSGSTVSSPVTIVASASDESGISVVRFFANDDLLEEIAEPPFEVVWQAGPGDYSVRVEAVDASPAENSSSVSASYTVIQDPTGEPPSGEWNDEDFSTVYEVGPEGQYQELADVPWESLGADTLIRVHWRSEPYRAKWVVNASGTADDPVVITGIPNGNMLPVVSGADAVTSDGLSYPNQERSIVKIGGSDVPSGALAEWIYIENLVIEGANPGNQFTSSAGQTRSYADNAASIHVQLGRNIFIRNNVLRDSGNGLFSGFQSSQLVISGNRFEGNGNTGSSSQHNSYTESSGILYEFNHFRPLKSGALGNNLKDRSAGTVVRYNWIESGSRQLDLVDSDHSEIYGSAAYGETFVYGNVLVEPASSNNGNIVHYGGDLSGREATYRKGTLHFYNNTIVSYRTDRTVLLGMSSNDESADVRNNLFYSAAGGSTLAITSGRGLIDLRGNWLQSGWDPSSESLTGTVNDLGNTEASNPAFADEDAEDFRLTDGSAAIDAGTELAGAAADNPVDRQYREHQGTVPRPVAGAIDAGAFEFEGEASLPAPVITTAALPDAEEGSTYSAFLMADEGTLPFSWELTAGMLPAGLALDADSGEISGTPTAVEVQTFTVVVTDANGKQDSAVLSMEVGAGEPPSGGSVLEGYSAATLSRDLSFVPGDLSGITYVPDTNTFFLIQNNGGRIWEVDQDFNEIRTILMNGFGDTEDIVYMGSNEFAIVEESSQLFIGTIGSLATQISTGDFQRIVFDTYSGNSGYEGVAYDSILETFYVVKESSPRRIRSFVRPSSPADTSVTADTPFDANQLPAADLSAVGLDTRTGRLLILSHESHKLMDVSLDGTVLGELAMADASQHEGVALDSSYNIYITSEPRSYRIYTQ